MSQPKTLRDVSGLGNEAPSLKGSALIMIDLQNTYREGVMTLEGVEPAIREAAALLERARQAGIPIFHVQHDAGAGSPYDLQDRIGAIADEVAPRAGEETIVKNYPSAFVGTELQDKLTATGSKDLILTGFMTHMCVNSTERSAFNLGYAQPTRSGRLGGLCGRIAAGEPRRAGRPLRGDRAEGERYSGLSRLPRGR